MIDECDSADEARKVVATEIEGPSFLSQDSDIIVNHSLSCCFLAKISLITHDLLRFIVVFSGLFKICMYALKKLRLIYGRSPWVVRGRLWWE